MKSPLRYRSIVAHSLRGFEGKRLAAEGFGDGINLMHGPNASGKSSLAEVMTQLLRPAEAMMRGEVWCDFEVDEQRWTAQFREGKLVTVHRDGDPVHEELPGPAGTEPGHYRLGLHQLLADERGELAERIAQVAAGGYHVGRAVESIRPPRLTGHRDLREKLELSEQVLERVRQEQQSLQTRERDELRKLIERRDEARDASQRAGHLKAALKWHELNAKRNRARAEYEAFDARIGFLREEDLDELRRIEKELPKLCSQKAEQEETVEKARLSRAKCGFDDKAPSEEDLENHTRSRDKLQQLQNSYDQLEEKLGRLQADRAERARALGSRHPKGELDLTLDEWPQLERIAAEAQRLRSGLGSVNKEIELLEAEGPDGDEERLHSFRKGVDRLEAWLADGSKRPMAYELLLWMAGLLVGSGTLLGFTAAAGWFALTGAGLLLPFVLRRYRWGGGGLIHLRESFLETGLEPPSRWEQDAVRERVTQLREQLRQEELAVARKDRLARLRHERSGLEMKLNELSRETESFAERYGAGFDPAGEVDLLAFAKSWLEWQKVSASLKEEQASFERARQQYDQALEQLREELARWMTLPGATRQELEKSLRELQNRTRRFHAAERERDDALDEIRRIEQNLEDEATRRKNLLDRLQLGEQEVGLVARFADEKAAFEEAQRTARDADVAESQARQNVEQADSTLLELKPDELQLLLEQKEQQAEAYEGLVEQVKELQDDIEEAEDTQELEQALAERDRIRRELAEKRNQALEGEVVQALTNAVRERSRSEHQPPVIERANQLFRKLTHHRWGLELREDDSFAGIDIEQNVKRPLKQLSSATRVQLLLAVRIAFIEQNERGVMMPLLVDEALANSDPERAVVIIETLLDVARTGRQLFYFTAQEDEVAKWQQVMKRHELKPVLIELGRRAAPTAENAFELPDLDDFGRVEVPAPGGQDRMAYARTLKVPKFRPDRDTVAGVHLWHLVPEPETLYNLLRHERIDSWGALRSLLRDRLPTGWDEAQSRSVQARARALEAAANAWRRGRGRPVSVELLERNIEPTPKMLEDLAAGVASTEGDATRLLHGIEDGSIKVRRFNEERQRAMRAFLESEGYLDERPPLSEDEVRARTLAAVTDELDEGLIQHDEVHELVDRMLRSLDS